MKKFIVLLTSLLIAAGTWAADYTAVAQQVFKKNGQRSYTGAFDQTKYIKMMKKEVLSAGTLYTTPGNMAMHYSQPAGDYLVINDKQFVMQTGGKKTNHNIQKGSPLLTLRNTLLNCMHGNIQAIADENNGTVSYTQEGGRHVFSIATQNKTPRGYSKVVLKYQATSLNLEEMVLEEVNGNYTVYKLSQLKDGAIDAARFTVK